MSQFSLLFVRWDTLQRNTLKTLNMKPEKWNKMAANEEYHGLIQGFLDKADIYALVINVTPSGLTASYAFPTSQKSKGITEE